MIEQILEDIGLSDKEASAYLALLRAGTRATSYIAKKASLNRGTAYVALHSLLEKGLVAKTVRNKVQYFSALDPKQLSRYLDRQKEEITLRREKLASVMESLQFFARPGTTRPAIDFFEGVEGARAAIEDTLTGKDRLLRAYLSIFDVQEFLGARWLEEYTRRRVRAGYELRVIRTEEKDRQAFARYGSALRYGTSKREHRTVKYTGEDLTFPLTMYVYDDKIAILSSKEENYAAIIRSGEFSSMQRRLFDVLWGISGGNRRA